MSGATRCDNRSDYYLASVKLASILIRMRFDESVAQYIFNLMFEGSSFTKPNKTAPGYSNPSTVQH